MALSASIYTISIDLSHIDRDLYTSISLKAAKHPSESDEYFVARLLAYCLEYREGIEFSAGGVSDPEWPAITVRDLTGKVTSWIEIGNPEAARLHKASKLSNDVAVYTHKNPALLLRKLRGEKIHAAEAIRIFSLPPSLIEGFMRKLDRRMHCGVTVTENRIFVDIGETTLDGEITEFSLSDTAAEAE